jgi:sugar lactone lactonase YvrE
MKILPPLFILTLLVSQIPLALNAQEPGTITTIAGGGEQEGEGIPATDLALNLPFGVNVDAAGNVYIADTFNHRIRRVDSATGLVATIAGTGDFGFSGDGAQATDALLNAPQSVAVDAVGNVYIADSGNGRIRVVDATTGIITTFAGTGAFDFSGDGGPASEAVFGELIALVIGETGVLYIADGIDVQGRGNNRVRAIDLGTGIASTVAGNGDFNFGGDGGPATEAGLTVEAIAVDREGALYIADFNNYRIRKVVSDTIRTIIGKGPLPFVGGGGFSGDGGDALNAQLNVPTGVAVDANGTVYFSDTGNSRIRAVDPETNIIVTIAGTGAVGALGDGGLAVEAQFNQPSRLAIDVNGNLIVADISNSRIRKLFDPRFRTTAVDLLSSQIDFGSVSVEDPQVRSFLVRNVGNKNLTIDSATSDNPDFVVIGQFPIIIGPARTDTIRLQFTPRFEGLAEGTLFIVTDDPRNPSLTVPVRGSGAAPDIGVNPDRVDFDLTFVGRETNPRIVQVTNLSVGTLILTNVVLSDTIQFTHNFSDSQRIQSSQSHNISITFRPTMSDTQRATLTLFSNDPDESALVVNLSGIGRIAKPGGFVNVSDSLGTGDPGASFGASWADYDGDGDPDLYVVRSLENNLLYRNDPSGFIRQGEQMGVADNGDGSGAAWADFDRDGDLDLYVTNFGQPNRLYRNDGTGFVPVEVEMGLDDIGDGYGAAWADVNQDGYPDLYVANFGVNRFYRNEGGSFSEVATELGIDDGGSSIQPAWADFDADGDPDLFLANSGANRLFENQGGVFVDATVDYALREAGLGGPSFGAAWGDFDNDGDLDLYVPYFGEGNRLYTNEGDRFRDLGIQFGVTQPDTGRSRGAVWGDFDNDGDLDLYVTNSGQANLLFQNDGERFTELADSFSVSIGSDSRGVALADYDGDGGLDLFVAVQNGADRLFKNQESNGNWLTIRPRGTDSSSDAICTRFEIVYDGGKRAIREITGGSSYLSQDALTATFGLNFASVVDTLTIRWPLGIVQRETNLSVNRILDITERAPLPPFSIRLSATTKTLIASGEAQTQIVATVLNIQDEITLVNNLNIVFSVDFGDGRFASSDTALVRDGRAQIFFQAGLIPGQVFISANSPGLRTGRITIDLLEPLGPEDTIIRTIAGSSSTSGFQGDGGPAILATLNFPRNVAWDTSGVVYIADTGNQRLRTIDADGIITTIAGTGLSAANGNGGFAIDASVNDPRGLTFMPDGDLIIGEPGGQVVRRIDLQTGIIDAFAGRGTSGFGGDGGLATLANMVRPRGAAADAEGNVWIADELNNRIRKVDTEGIITTVAGSSPGGFSGDGGPGTSAQLNRPLGVAVDSTGNVYVADTGNHRIRKIDTEGIITTIAGVGSGFAGDGGPAVLARMNAPRDIALDAQGHLFVADTDNHRIRVIDLNTGIIQTVAGTAFPDAGPDEERSGLETSLNTPSGLFASPEGVVYIADSNNHRIRQLTISFPGVIVPEPPDSVGTGDLTADFNGDGSIGFSDFVLFASAFGSTDLRYDLSGNGRVAFEDFVQFVAAFEQSRGFKPVVLRRQ